MLPPIEEQIAARVERAIRHGEKLTIEQTVYRMTFGEWRETRSARARVHRDTDGSLYVKHNGERRRVEPLPVMSSTTPDKVIFIVVQFA